MTHRVAHAVVPGDAVLIRLVLPVLVDVVAAELVGSLLPPGSSSRSNPDLSAMALIWRSCTSSSFFGTARGESGAERDTPALSPTDTMSTSSPTETIPHVLRHSAW